MDSSEDLRALLARSQDCDGTIAEFASNYQGRTVEFDGYIAAMNNHVDRSTRYDILILAGDSGNTSPTGPNFQYNDVGIFDLHLTGANVPDSTGIGDNLHVIATVKEYDRGSCLLVLVPVSTELR